MEIQGNKKKSDKNNKNSKRSQLWGVIVEIRINCIFRKKNERWSNGIFQNNQ